MARCSNGHQAASDAAGQRFCTVCGAPMLVVCPNGHEVEAAAHCTVCGAPLGAGAADAAEAGSPPPPEPPDPDHSRRSWLVVGGAVALVLLIGAGVYLGVTRSNGSNGQATPAGRPAATAPAAPAAPSTGSSSESPTEAPTTTAAPPATTPSPAPKTVTTTAPPSTTTIVQPPGPATSAAAVVEQYFADIDVGDYAGAWAIGGRNLQGGTYDSFVQGFSTTAFDTVTIVSTDGGTVQMRLDALQTDGTHKFFAGSYTVRDGVIVAADVRQTG